MSARLPLVVLCGLLGAGCGSGSPPGSPDTRPAADSGGPAKEGSVAGAEAGGGDQDGGEAPDGPSAQPGEVGDPCTKSTTCENGGSGVATCRASWPGGYCLIEGCSSGGHDCPGDPGMGQSQVGAAKCVISPVPTCLLVCAAESDCREGYQCAGKADAMGHGQVKVCIPK